MIKYFDSVLRQTGGPYPDVVVTVLLFPSEALAPIYTDDGSGPIADSAVTTDARGFFEFFCDPGRYILEFSVDNAIQRTIVNVDVGGIQVLEDLADDAVDEGAALIAASQSVTYAAGTLGAHYNDLPSVKDAPYSVTNTGDQAAKFTTIRAIAKTFTIPAGAYVLASAPTTGPAAMLVSPNATFSGAGTTNNLPDWGYGLFPDTTGANIWRFQDRLFVGLPTTGNRTGAQNSILPDAAAGAGYLCRDGQLVSVSPYGQIAVVGFSRSSDTPDPVLTDCIGVAGGVINNRTDGRSWAGYFDVQHEGTEASSQGIETALKNTSGVTRKYTPFGITGASPGGGVIGWQCFAGGDPAYGGVSNAPMTTGINFVATVSATALSTGINFGSKSIVGNDGDGTGDGDAILYATGHRQRWMSSTTNTIGSIWAQSTTSSQAVHQKFGANKIEFQRDDGTANVFQISSSATAVNFLVAGASATGGNPNLTASGSDTNLSALIIGKGTGGAILRDGGAANKFEVNTTGIGFFATSPVVKQTITGSRGGNAALASLLTAGATYGLWIDSTTA